MEFIYLVISLQQHIFDLINKDGGDEILFAEFIDWALGKDLDIEDDDDF